MAHPVCTSPSLPSSRPASVCGLGFDIANNEFRAYGSPAQYVSFTSLRDICRTVARLVILSTDADACATSIAAAASVPDDVGIAGAIVTFEDVREIIARVRGPDGESGDNWAPGVPFHECIRVVTAEGKLNLGEANDNELVNPGGSLWKFIAAKLITGSYIMVVYTDRGIQDLV
ncbi:hypothetical protein GSI_11095 [Ganoderma sinense ZZ0214-1]|uniref:Uncharacterized protein n=1 Tax=Ganoderma sinense ZZ0214-1 TaxID=1077348 RepID=A0A2G8RZ88_9APHY|nr:hypothetical protein GSI_11095 [Ganoderma sinense ZZ0214-1]